MVLVLLEASLLLTGSDAWLNWGVPLGDAVVELTTDWEGVPDVDGGPRAQADAEDFRALAV